MNPDSFALVSPHDLYHVGLYGTNDQNEIIIRLLKTKWSKVDEVLSRELAFINLPSIFNVLIHYVGATLIYDNSARIPFVRYNELLRWQELVVEIGEELPVATFLASWHYKRGTEQKHFDWKPYLDHDNHGLNNIFKQGLADIHNHLKGTSLNFELNWLSLMNHISNRLKTFNKLGGSLYITHEIANIQNSLYQDTVKACAIRLWLFQLAIRADGNIIKQSFLWRILDCENDLQMTEYAMELQESVDAARSLYGHSFRDMQECKSDIPDYANTLIDNSIYAVLGGERKLLYDIMMQLLDGSEKYANTTSLLHCYIVIKCRLRHELVQLNNQVGFSNFADYQNRKEHFILEGSIYDHLISQIAVYGYLTEGDNRYIETRISPKKTRNEMSSYIKKTNADILNTQFADKRLDLTGKYHYTCHFIKNAEKNHVVKSALLYRNYETRKVVEKQARAIFNLRNSNSETSHYIVGIDAANSEILCRPEVFSQAFRYLRNHEIDDAVLHRPSNLGMTFHVGEDFYDIVDGLRAIDEVLLFLNLDSGDRLGHALVLGTDIERYYEKRDYTISMTKQTLLDNLCWLYVKCQGCLGDIPICQFLMRQFRKYVREVYGEVVDIDTYYQSWLLRGDNPEEYLNWEVEPMVKWRVDPWQRSSLNVKFEIVNEARSFGDARHLYHKYHFAPSVKANSSDGETLQIPQNERNAFIELVHSLQQFMLNKVREHNLRIECNPTSNYKIGEMMRYDEHPILKFYNVGLSKLSINEIPVSINTDDKGVFATSHEREYSLMALALEKNVSEYAMTDKPQIQLWIDNIRKMGLEHRFSQKTK